MVLTTPHILIPTSRHFLMHRSASLQYWEGWCRVREMVFGSVETIMRTRSGPIPLFFSSMARSTAVSRIVTALKRVPRN